MRPTNNSLIYPKNSSAVAAQSQPVQWGGMVRGALIITGVVVAAVAGYWLATGGVELIAEAIGSNSVVGPALTDAWNWVGNAGNWVGAQVSSAVSWVGAQFSGATGTLTAGMPTGPVAPAAVDTVGKAAGIVGALGGGIFAAKHMAAMPVMMDHTNSVAVSTPLPDITAPSADMGHSASVLPQKKAAVHASMADASTHGGELADIPDMPDEVLAAKSTASKIVHHAGEHAHESWSHRMSKKAAALSHADSVLASRQAAPAAAENRIPEPKATYLADLEDSRAKLDTALNKA